jgi:hypothetical protein
MSILILPSYVPMECILSARILGRDGATVRLCHYLIKS